LKREIFPRDDKQKEKSSLCCPPWPHLYRNQSFNF
jgi:hypothetical protein